MPKGNFGAICAKNWYGFWGWIKHAIETICNRPDHLQRLAIIGAGMAAYPIVLLMIYIVWKGYAPTPELQAASLNFMGFALFGAMAMFALVVVTMLGTIKGVSLKGPGGIEIDLQTTADDPDIGPETPRAEASATIRQSGRRRGGGGTTVVVNSPAAPAEKPAGGISE